MIARIAEVLSVPVAAICEGEMKRMLGWAALVAAVLATLALQAQVSTALAPGPPRVDVRSEPSDAPLARQLGDLAEGFLAALPEAELSADRRPITLILAHDGERFRRLAGGRSPEWAAGLILVPGETILLDKEYVLDLGQAATLIRHELAHVLLDRKLGERPVPRWFHEGYAQMRAAEWDMEVLWRLARAAWTKSAIPLGDLRRSFPASGPRAMLAYAESQAAVQELAREPESWAHLMALLEEGMPFSDALERSRGETLQAFQARFDASIMPGFRRWGLLFGTAPLFFVMMLLFLAAAWRRVRRGRTGDAPAPLEGEFEQNEWLRRGWIDRVRRR